MSNRRRIYVAVACLVASGLALFVLKSLRHDGPRIALSSDRVNLGSLEPDGQAAAKIVVGNVGSAPLEILGVLAECGCTTTDLRKSIILPGERTTLHIDFDGSGFLRSVRKRVVITTNDPNQRDSVIEITAYVKAGFRMDLEKLRLGTGRRGQKLAAEVHVIRDLDGDRSPVVVAGLDHGIDAVAGPWLEVDDALESEVTFTVTIGAVSAGLQTRRVSVVGPGGQSLPLEISYGVEPAVASKDKEAVLRFPAKPIAEIELYWPSTEVPRFEPITAVFGTCTARVIEMKTGQCTLEVTAPVKNGRPYERETIDVLRVAYHLRNGSLSEDISIPVRLVDEQSR